MFTGSDVRVRDPDLPLLHFALAFEGAAWTDPDAIPLMVIQSMIGAWNRNAGAGAPLTGCAGTRRCPGCVSGQSVHSTVVLWVLLITSARCGAPDSGVRLCACSMVVAWQPSFCLGFPAWLPARQSRAQETLARRTLVCTLPV